MQLKIIMDTYKKAKTKIAQKNTAGIPNFSVLGSTKRLSAVSFYLLS